MKNKMKKIYMIFILVIMALESMIYTSQTGSNEILSLQEIAMKKVGLRFEEIIKHAIKFDTDINEIKDPAMVEIINNVRSGIFPASRNFIKDSNLLLDVVKAAKENKNSIQIIALLLEADANPDLADDYGWAPLHYAARNNSVGMAMQLIQASANKNILNSDHRSTPLVIAILNNAVGVARLLIENGANLELADDYGFAPLHYAARENAVDVARLLIEKGAIVDVLSNEHRSTPLIIYFNL